MERSELIKELEIVRYHVTSSKHKATVDKAIDVISGSEQNKALKELTDGIYSVLTLKQNWDTFKDQWLVNGECKWLKDVLNILLEVHLVQDVPTDEEPEYEWEEHQKTYGVGKEYVCSHCKVGIRQYINQPHCCHCGVKMKVGE